MRFGLLATDEETMRLVHAAASTNHEFTVAFDSGDYAEPLMRCGVVVKDQSWEDLLHAPECDAVIVGRAGDAEIRADQLRKLTQAAVPLVVVHPAGDMLLCFELQMIQQDTGGLIVPYFPGLEHPRLTNWGPFPSVREPATVYEPASGGELPVMKQVLLERDVTDPLPDSVSDQFSRDALLLRRWVGRINKIGALGANPYPSDDWGNLSVHMTTHSGAIARWSARPSADNGQAGQVTAVWDGGNETIPLPNDVDTWENHSTACDTWVLDAIEQGVADSKRAQGINDLWEDACRANELADTIHPSYRRGKTIELYHEKHTEEETFKGMMAAGGCLALMAVIFFAPMLSALHALDLPFFEGDGWDRWPWKALHYRVWHFYLAFALGLFLTLQLLRLVFRPEPKTDNHTANGDESASGSSVDPTG